MIRSLKTRIAVWYIALSTAILAGFGLIVYLNLAHGLRRERENVVIGYIERIRAFALDQSQLNQSRVDEKSRFLHEFDEGFSLKLESEYIQISTPDGANLYLSPNLGGRPLPHKPELSVEGRPKLQVVEAFAERQRVLMAVTPISVKGETELVTVAASLAAEEETERRLLLTLLLALPVAILTALAGSAFLARRAIKPLEQMAGAAQLITAQNLNERIKLSHADIELERLAESFNQMVTRLEKSFNQVRQFTADASHELRTPLTILKGEAQLALDGRLNPDEYCQVLRSRGEELERMIRIVDDLLLLSRADSRAAELDYQIVDLSDLVIESCERLRPYAEAGHLKLVVENVEPAEVNGDSLRLGQMFRNVLENAIKYTPEGGEIKVQLMRNNADQCQITVTDTGIGIPAADLPRVFDRFFRVDKARSRERGGSGLGLSIVKWVVEAHAGEIFIESDMGRGTIVKIFLPSLTARVPLKKFDADVSFAFQSLRDGSA
ncbi:MAG: heavy metal sensor histidine kinase [Chloracidobacterium sp.]|nr:heavy metal sensor histidine kinase [Chloracidobacterium sp.]